VQLALPSEEPATIRIEKSFTEPIVDLQTSTVELEVTDTAALAEIQASVDIEHTYIGDLVVTLIPPGTMAAPPVVLHNRQGGRTVNLRRGYDTGVAPGLAAYAGKSAKGTWQLEVRDEARIDTGLIRKFGLELRITNGAPRRVRVEKKPARKRRK
jgi:subtilisin-like proprotein convertase family protein